MKNFNNYPQLKAEAARIKLEIPLIDYFFKLERLKKIRYDKKIGKEDFFAFDHQKTGSISINTNNNEWYDHSNGEGGDIIKACQKFENKTFFEAIKSLSNNHDIVSQERLNIKNENISSSYKIDQIKDNIVHPALISYIKERGLDLMALKGFANEVHWRKDEKKFFGIGLKNINGGYAIRSSIFKGNINETGISITNVGNRPISIKIFEGLMDFGSYRTLQPDMSYIAFILNSTANLTPKVIDMIKDYANGINKASIDIHSYLDNDEGGLTATKKILNVIEGAQDKSRFYIKLGLNDVNDYLRVKQNEEYESFKMKR